jgi:hypothetical protein
MKFIVIALALLASPALAQDEERLRSACTADALAFCGRAIPLGRSYIVACMKEHRASLSAECLAASSEAFPRVPGRIRTKK